METLYRLPTNQNEGEVIMVDSPPSQTVSSVQTPAHQRYTASAPYNPLHANIDRVLINESALKNRVEELGQIVTHEYKDKDPLLISVLKGSFIFMADLVRCVHIPHELDFMSISSYGSGVQSSGVVQILKDLSYPIENRHVLVVEDIIDSGHTLSYLLRIMKARQPASLRTMTLLDKPERREVDDIDVDWTGFSIPNEFVVGYGLDYDEQYRNLPYIGILKPSVYAEQ